MTPSAYSNARSAATDGRILAAIAAFDAGSREHEATLNALESLYAVGPTPDSDAVASLAETLPPAPVAHPELEHDAAHGDNDAAE